MSHITKVSCQFNDLETLKAACTELGIKFEAVKDYKFYDSSVASGLAVHLPGWKYPAVITEDGNAVYDNYNGAWGSDDRMSELRQSYSTQTIKKIAKKKGFKLTETTLEDGRKQLVALVK